MVDGRYPLGVRGLNQTSESFVDRAYSALGRIANLGSDVFEQGLTVGFRASVGSRVLGVSFVLGGDSAPANVVLGPNTVGILDDPASYDETGFDTNVLDTDPTNNFGYYEERISTITDNLLEGHRDDFIVSFLSQFRSYLNELRRNNVAENDRTTAKLIEEALIIILKIESKVLSSIDDAKLKKRFDILQAKLAEIEKSIGCITCRIAMRPAGSAYVCEGCGSTDFETQKYVDSRGNGDDDPSVGGSDSGKEGPDDGEDDGGSVPGVPRKPIPGAGFTGATQVDGGDTESSPEALESLVDIGNRLTNQLEHLESLRYGFIRNTGNSPYFVYVGGNNGLQAMAKAVWADLLVLSKRVDFAVVLDAGQANGLTKISEFNSNTENVAIRDAFDFIIGLLGEIISGLQTRSQYRSSKT